MCLHLIRLTLSWDGYDGVVVIPPCMFFSPPSWLHELDFMTSYDMVYVPTHDLFVLDLFLFMMKHIGRYFNAILEWFYW